MLLNATLFKHFIVFFIKAFFNFRKQNPSKGDGFLNNKYETLVITESFYLLSAEKENCKNSKWKG